MGTEIEKKYLLWDDQTSFVNSGYATKGFHSLYDSIITATIDVIQNGSGIYQGYFDVEKGKDVAKELGLNLDFDATEARIRSIDDQEFFFTMKGKGGLQRNELEEKIKYNLFLDLWKETEGKRVNKIRLKKPYQGFTAELDVYTDRSLIVAEIEFPSIELANSIEALGMDITEDSAYKNKNLAK